MAIETIKTPHQTADAGIFNLPPEFDTTQFASEWVEKGQVNFKQQRQVLAGTKYTADGWSVWKKESKDRPTVVTGSNSKEYVLMCRPTVIQKQVNAIFGNVSKQKINQEIQGAVTARSEGAANDPGIIPEERLKTILPGEDARAAEDSAMTLNETAIS